MKVIEIVKFPDRKHKSICVYDTEDKSQTRYVIGFIQRSEALFKEALIDSYKIKYVYEETVEK